MRKYLQAFIFFLTTVVNFLFLLLKMLLRTNCRFFYIEQIHRWELHFGFQFLEWSMELNYLKKQSELSAVIKLDWTLCFSGCIVLSSLDYALCTWLCICFTLYVHSDCSFLLLSHTSSMTSTVSQHIFL